MSLPTDALAHLDALFHVARYLTGDDASAEDLVQETFARALGAQASFERGTNLRAWLMRILRNAFIDQTRRDKHATELDEDVADDKAEPLRTDLAAADIERALLELAPDARAVILLDLEGLSEAELADAMECAPGTIKSRLSRARAALRKRLAAYGRDA